MKYERHPLSAAWPDMAREDFDALVLSIKAHGLREPITLMDGLVLDGWHRYQACEKAGVAGVFETFGGTVDAAEALVNDRHTRRNITPGQRAAAALMMSNWRTGSGSNRKQVENRNVTVLTTQQVADKAGVSASTVEKVKAAVKADENALEKIRTGKATATKIVKEAKPKSDPKPKPAKPDVAVPDDRDARIEKLEEQLTELASNLEQCNDENASMARVFDANDQVTAALAEAKRSRELARVLQERVNGLMNEKNEYIKAAKRWQRKFDALEKQMAVSEF